jgi:integrase
MKLTPADLNENKLFLYMQKTRVPVYVPLPQHLMAELKALPLTGGYFFWSREGNSQLETATGNARRSFRKICKEAKVKNGHPHRFRDTFAVNLLLQGVALETVSILLGHTSIKITQKHYSPWVKSRQQKLESEIERTWPNPKLVRVK